MHNDCFVIKALIAFIDFMQMYSFLIRMQNKLCQTSVFLCIICKLEEKFLLLQRAYEQEDSNIRRIAATLLQIQPHATDSGSDVFGSLRRKRGQCSSVVGHDGRRRGICMPNTLWGGDRMGTYYYEESAGMRSSKVVYDRANSAFFELKPGMFNWREILKDADVFHASGITGAISKDSCEATFEALNIADEMGKTISFDINHRKNLWKYGADPRETLSRMLEYADVVFGDIIEYEFIMNRQVPFEATDSNYKMPLDFYEEWFDEIHSRFPRCNKWLMGMRNMMSSNHNTLTALLWSDGKLYHTRIDDIHDIVDAMGVGDAFTAGQLHALRAFPGDDQRVLDFALAAATLKYSIPGDANLCTEAEILEFLDNLK